MAFERTHINLHYNENVHNAYRQPLLLSYFTNSSILKMLEMFFYETSYFSLEIRGVTNQNTVLFIVTAVNVRNPALNIFPPYVFMMRRDMDSLSKPYVLYI
jgi:hypothetical protein